MSSVAELEKELAEALGESTSAHPSSPRRRRPKKTQATARRENAPIEERDVEPPLPPDLAPLDERATIQEHIREGTTESLVLARKIVRGEVTADARTQMQAARMLAELGVKSQELEMQRQRDEAKKRLTQAQVVALRRRTLAEMLRQAG